jgi:hypothetical protein
VNTVTNSYLDARLGYNATGQLVYEPRDAHKGDAARALLYMALRYDGVDNHAWTFNALNTALPGLSEAPQDLTLLLDWHAQDPPDAYEMTRNDYIESVQLNRNPFVDHPEYTQRIDFSTLSYILPTAVQHPSTKAFEPWVYPIPSLGNVTVVLENGGVPLTLKWYSALGGLVKVVSVSSGEAFDASDLPAGLYMLTVQSSHGFYTTRWIKN